MSVSILDIDYDINTTLTLNLSNRYLGSIPIEIRNLINLQKLYLHCNNLTHIPVEIDVLGNLTNLEELSLHYNKLTSIPPEIGKLTNLKYLHLDNNNLTNIPAEIGNLTNLEIVVLCSNNLTNIPAEIGNLTNLEKVLLCNNNLTNIPSDILKIKSKLVIDETSYQIDNLDLETEILIFTELKSSLKNLPISLKEIHLDKNIENYDIAIPFGCEIKLF